MIKILSKGTYLLEFSLFPNFPGPRSVPTPSEWHERAVFLHLPILSEGYMCICYWLGKSPISASLSLLCLRLI